jgi:hypothetical protein
MFLGTATDAGVGRKWHSEGPGRRFVPALVNLTEVSKEIEMTQLAGGDQAVDDSGSFGTSVTPTEHPILAADGNGPKDSLRQVVVYVNVTVVEVLVQSPHWPRA